LVETLVARRGDWKLLTTLNGRQGIEMASLHKPDVILTDINLPDISGLAALKILRENPATADIPVIALSSNAYPPQIEEGLEAGFFRYLTKPFRG
jgi:CheY-like chemotaxis protein